MKLHVCILLLLLCEAISGEKCTDSDKGACENSDNGEHNKDKYKKGIFSANDPLYIILTVFRIHLFSDDKTAIVVDVTRYK